MTKDDRNLPGIIEYEVLIGIAYITASVLVSFFIFSVQLKCSKNSFYDFAMAPLVTSQQSTDHSLLHYLNSFTVANSRLIKSLSCSNITGTTFMTYNNGSRLIFSEIFATIPINLITYSDNKTFFYGYRSSPKCIEYGLTESPGSNLLYTTRCCGKVCTPTKQTVTLPENLHETPFFTQVSCSSDLYSSIGIKNSYPRQIPIHNVFTFNSSNWNFGVSIFDALNSIPTSSTLNPQIDSFTSLQVMHHESVIYDVYFTVFDNINQTITPKSYPVSLDWSIGPDMYGPKQCKVLFSDSGLDFDSFCEALNQTEKTFYYKSMIVDINPNALAMPWSKMTVESAVNNTLIQTDAVNKFLSPSSTLMHLGFTTLQDHTQKLSFTYSFTEIDVLGQTYVSYPLFIFLIVSCVTLILVANVTTKLHILLTPIREAAFRLRQISHFDFFSGNRVEDALYNPKNTVAFQNSELNQLVADDFVCAECLKPIPHSNIVFENQTDYNRAPLISGELMEKFESSLPQPQIVDGKLKFVNPWDVSAPKKTYNTGKCLYCRKNVAVLPKRLLYRITPENNVIQARQSMTLSEAKGNVEARDLIDPILREVYGGNIEEDIEVKAPAPIKNHKVFKAIMNTYDNAKQTLINTWRLRETKVLSASGNIMWAGLRSFAHYVPAGVAESVLLGKAAKLGMRRVHGVVMFLEFDELKLVSQNPTATDYHVVLSSVFELCCSAIISENGVIDKLFGNGLMAYWTCAEGDNTPPSEFMPDFCLSAVRAAAKIETLIHAFNNNSKNYLKNGLYVQMGITSGQFLSGNLGFDQGLNTRYDYTVIGDRVNTANRLMRLNHLYHSHIIVDAFLSQMIASLFISRWTDTVIVKGKRKAEKVYVVVGPRNANTVPLLERAESYEKCLDALFKCNYNLARNLITDFKIKYPDSAWETENFEKYLVTISEQRVLNPKIMQEK